MDKSDGSKNPKPKGAPTGRLKLIHDCPLEKLTPYDRNPRQNDEAVKSVAKSIAAFGFNAPIIVDKDYRICVGHTRYKAALESGMAAVPVLVVGDMTDEQFRGYNIADNQTGTIAEWDNAVLAELLAELEREANPEEPETPPLPEEPTSRPGDLWMLGEHRLVCGDSTNSADVERLMAGQSADLLFTDPPYGVAYVGKTKDALTIENDEESDEKTGKLLVDALGSAPLKEGGAFYICAPAGHTETVFRNSIAKTPLLLKQCIVWVKDIFVMGRQDYHWRHESILYGWRKGAGHNWLGGRTQDTVWNVDRPRASREHPTMKPVALAALAISNSSRKGELVLDLFGGSGTTLLACEQLGRRCNIMELDPRYADVIVRRWELFTEGKAELKRADAPNVATTAG